MKTIYMLLIGLAIIGIIITGYFIFYNHLNENKDKPLYQGPVRPTDNEAYFRQTGITKPLEVSE